MVTERVERLGRARRVPLFRRYDQSVKVVVVIIALLINANAHAQVARIDLEVGDMRVVNAGNAVGWFCDDPTLVIADMISRGNYNEWVVTGALPGVTHCRIGTELGRKSFVIEVQITAPSSRRIELPTG